MCISSITLMSVLKVRESVCLRPGRRSWSITRRWARIEAYTEMFLPLALLVGWEDAVNATLGVICAALWSW